MTGMPVFAPAPWASTAPEARWLIHHPAPYVVASVAVVDGAIDCHRRFRDGLFVAQLSSSISDRHAEKIDWSFVQKVTTDRRNAELVKAVISIAQCLGLQVMAEGVETLRQAAFLAAHGCRIAQGFLYSKPRTKSDMDSLPRHLAVAHP